MCYGITLQFKLKPEVVDNKMAQMPGMTFGSLLEREALASLLTFDCPAVSARNIATAIILCRSGSSIKVAMTTTQVLQDAVMF